MELLADPQVWLALFTLTALEIVLGIDNVIFISVLAGRLPPEQRPKARFIGLSLAMLMRVLLLLALSWIMGLKETLFTVFDHAFSSRDIILFGGGLFLLAKSTMEIHNSLEADEESQSVKAASFWLITLQIVVIDIVFSLDSVITAIGMAEHIQVMIAAVIIAVGVMMLASGAISAVIERHPTLKMLALSFLLLIGVALVGESLGMHIPKGYLYFSMAFSVMVEILNIRLRKPARPVELRKTPKEMERRIAGQQAQ